MPCMSAVFAIFTDSISDLFSKGFPFSFVFNANKQLPDFSDTAPQHNLQFFKGLIESKNSSAFMRLSSLVHPTLGSDEVFS